MRNTVGEGGLRQGAPQHRALPHKLSAHARRPSYLRRCPALHVRPRRGARSATTNDRPTTGLRPRLGITIPDSHPAQTPGFEQGRGPVGLRGRGFVRGRCGRSQREAPARPAGGTPASARAPHGRRVTPRRAAFQAGGVNAPDLRVPVCGTGLMVRNNRFKVIRATGPPGAVLRALRAPAPRVVLPARFPGANTASRSR